MADQIGIGSGVIAAIGLLFTGYQVWLLNRQARYDRSVVIDGVAVSWRPVVVPSRAERTDGTATWLYELMLIHPDRLPIDNVRVRWTFPCDVVRIHHDGTTGPATKELVLGAPVVIGGEQRTWQRHLLIDFQRKSTLSETYAEIEFNDVEGRPRTNRWPRTPMRPSALAPPVIR